MEKDFIMFILQGLLGATMLGFGTVLNGFRKSFEEVEKDLKALNNAVLGQYVTRNDMDQRWLAQRSLDHELRTMIQEIMVRQARAEGAPYRGPGEK